MELVRFAKQRSEYRASSQGVEPRITDHGGIAEEAVIDGAGQHIQRPGFLAEVAELPRQIIHALRIAESCLQQLFAGLEAFLAVALKKRAQGSDVEAAQAPRAGCFRFAKLRDGFWNLAEHGENQDPAIAIVAG